MSNVSVIIVNYNSGDMLERSVQSLLETKYVTEIFVVDNGSKDKSIEAIEHMGLSKSRLKCIRNGKNLGFAKACNKAVLLAGESDYLLFLNPDCFIMHGALERLLACMNDTTQAGMAGPLLLNPDGIEQAGGRRAVPTPWRSFVRAFGLYKLSNRYPKLFSDFLLHKEPLPDMPIEVEAISGSCMLVRRQAINDVGMMDEGYFLHCEDLDWCMRLRQHGWKIMFVPGASAVHYQGTCSNARPVFVEWYKHKGMIRFYGKFFHHQYPGILFWLVKAGVWLRFFMMAIYCSAQKLRQRLKGKL